MDRFRTTIEQRIVGDPDNFVADACTGPLPWDGFLSQIDIDIKQVSFILQQHFTKPTYNCCYLTHTTTHPQAESTRDRLISSLEECVSQSEAMKAFMVKTSRGEEDIVFATLMNISLEDETNWLYWKDTLQLSPNCPDPTKWAQITCPQSVPRRYFPSEEKIPHHRHPSTFVDVVRALEQQTI